MEAQQHRDHNAKEAFILKSKLMLESELKSKTNALFCEWEQLPGLTYTTGLMVLLVLVGCLHAVVGMFPSVLLLFDKNHR